MTTPATPASPTPAGDHHHHGAAPTILSFEDRLRILWQKNGKAVMVCVGLIIVGIFAKGVWEYLEAQKELEIQKEFSAASTSEKLKTFIGAHAGHTLASVAKLQLADEAYAAGKSAEAVSGYEEVLAAIKTGPLVSRARLGLAMAKIQGGKTADGETALKALATDATEAKATRVEASYHLASLASVAGKAEDVQKYSDLVMQLDPTSPWTQRVFLLRAALPVAGAAPVIAAPAIKLPGK